ncbi:MAG: tetratricopeptide repeat protein [Sneathiella sp.]
MPQLKNKLSLNKTAVLVATSIFISGCNTTSQSETSAKNAPDPIVAESSEDKSVKGLSHSKLMSVAARAWERGNASTALRLYNMAAQKKPADISPYLKMATILRKTKRTDAAIEIYNRLLEHKPNLIEAHTGLGYSILNLNKPYLAAQSFETALLIEPENARSLGGMAVALDTAGEHDKAQDYYRLAIKSDTNNLIYQNNLALSLALVGRLEQAIAMFEIITAHPNAIAQHRQNLALVYGMAGKSADAMRYSRMDLSEGDARNNALYFQALNSTPAASPSEEEGQALLMKKEQHAQSRPLETSRQPYEPLIARSEYTELNTRSAPAIIADEPPVRLHQNNEIRHARIPLTAADLMANATNEKPVSQDVAAVPLSPVTESPLSSPEQLPKADVRLPAMDAKAAAIAPAPKAAQNIVEAELVPAVQKVGKVNIAQNNQYGAAQSYFAQLGSYRSVERAKYGWKLLLNTHADLLSDFQPTYTKVDLGSEKGIFYRVRVGAFNSKKTPLELCQTLRNRAQGCYMPITSKNSPIMIKKAPDTNPMADEKLREVNLKDEAPLGTPFLISYRNVKVAKSNSLSSAIASY